MVNTRLIARLDIKGPNLVKGVHLEGMRVLGKPERFARLYYEQGADELIYMDPVASLYGRNSLLEIIERTSKEIFIPITVGGGIRTIEDIRTVLRAGADKVAINTAGVNQPSFFSQAAMQFGSSTIVASIEAIKKPDNSYEAFTDNGREGSGLNAIEWASKTADLGAGEIMVTSIDQEGTGRGFDLELTHQIATSVNIPVIACGGAGKLSDILDVVSKGNADAVGMASILHYEALKNFDIVKDEYASEGNTEYISTGKGFSLVEPASLKEIKRYLNDQNIQIRF